MNKTENQNENLNYFNDYNNEFYKTNYYNSSYRNQTRNNYKADFSHIKSSNPNYRITQPSNYNNPNFKILDKIEYIYPFTFYYKLHNDILEYSNEVLERIQSLQEIKLFTISHLEKIIKNTLGIILLILHLF